MIYAIATKCSVYLYDTQQKLPFGLISNIHYTRLTDLAWSNDGNTILASSTDGYCSIVQFSDGELGQIYKAQTIQDILTSKTQKDEMKKKKKTKKSTAVKKDDEVDKSPTSNENQKMVVDDPSVTQISITILPESVKEIIPVNKIIKSSEIFSPEKQVGSPPKPIQVRKYPRNTEEADLSPSKNDGSHVPVVTTPKASSFFSSNKTPSRIEVRRHARTPQTQAAGKANDGEDLSKTLPQSPMDRKLPPVSDKPAPKTPRRIELKTISTPKSKKKLL